MTSTQEQLVPARGKALDALANLYGLQRKRYFWLFRESDSALRERVLDVFFAGLPARIVLFERERGPSAWLERVKKSLTEERASK